MHSITNNNKIEVSYDSVAVSPSSPTLSRPMVRANHGVRRSHVAVRERSRTMFTGRLTGVGAEVRCWEVDGVVAAVAAAGVGLRGNDSARARS